MKITNELLSSMLDRHFRQEQYSIISNHADTPTSFKADWIKSDTEILFKKFKEIKNVLSNHNKPDLAFLVFSGNEAQFDLGKIEHYLIEGETEDEKEDNLMKWFKQSRVTDYCAIYYDFFVIQTAGTIHSFTLDEFQEQVKPYLTLEEMSNKFPARNDNKKTFKI